MTNKSPLKKVVKNIEKPKIRRINYEIVKHFEPSAKYAACRTNLEAQIPLVNVDSNNDKPKSPKRVYTPTKRQTSIKIPSPREPTIPDVKRYRNASDGKGRNQSRVEQKYVKKPTHTTYKSSSSSSLESKFEKFTNNCRFKSKSFNADAPKQPSQAQKLGKSPREKVSKRISMSPSKNGSFKSITDPALIQRELNLKSLKQEILENKRLTTIHRHQPDISGPKSSPRVEGLKAEILQDKSNNIMQRKIFITELRSEIAQYKQFNSNFHIYNTHEEGGNSNHKSDENNDTPKSSKNDWQACSNPKKVSIFDPSSVRKYSNGTGSALELNPNKNIESSKQPSSTGTENESTLDTTDRPSNSTLEDLSRPDLKSKDISDPDEDVIRNKIQEANQLIDRVKKALSKIKAIKSCDNYEPGKSRDNKSSSTDIEDTIKNLKEETDQLIIGDTEEQCFETDAEKPKFRSCCPIGSVPPKQTRKNSSQENKEDHISVSSPLNRSLVRECKEKRCTAASDEEPKSVNDAETFEYPDNSDNGAACQYYDKYGARRCNIDLERPKTRRNEADDDLTEQLRKDKFRSCPESGHLEVTSSFEELQEKLQTISESTESSYSTPRKKQKDASADQHCKCCGTEQPETENIEIQICPDTITSGVGCDCLSEDKSLQATILRPLTKKVTIESLSPKRKSLEITNLRPQKIGSGNRNCSRCKVESLPVLELRSEPEQRVCHKCKMELKEEHLDGVSIPPKLNKLQKLTIKVLPPIIIQQAMTITKVLNLSINPQGETENRIENTHNIVFVDVKTLKVAPIVEDFDKERTLNYLSDDVQELSINRLSLDENMKSENEHRANADNSDPCNKSEGTLRKEINADNDFVLSEKEYEDGISRLTSDEEEELRKKMLWYKSFHIYDNPNRHDPGKLDQMSMEKISQIDINFYKTFIDPNAILSQEYFSPSTSRYTGFESKMVQCNESMLMDPDKRSNKAEASKNYNKSLFLDLKNASGNEDMESQVTVLRTHGDHLTTPGHPPEPKSSPSEITVTISYTLSSEGGSPVKTRSEIQESEVAATNLDLQSQDLDEGGSMKRQPQTKVLTLADKAVLNKLREKLKSVDTTASIPMYTLTRDSANGETIDNFLKGLTAFEETENTHSLTNRKPKSKGKDHTVNYLFKDETTPLDSSYRKHLELGKNGRYMDEENMFTQLPHPTVANMSKSTKVPHQSIEFKDAKPYSFEHKDKEVTKNKFKTIPRHRLKRYSPDTSNSDTVTTNSISEGEIRCKHSVSNGEIHICRHSPQCPRMRRNVLTRKNVAFSQTHRSPHSVACSVPKKFDVNDSKVTIEQRRNYFNNWVTYYVRTQDVHETSTTSCSNNKQ